MIHWPLSAVSANKRGLNVGECNAMVYVHHRGLVVQDTAVTFPIEPESLRGPRTVLCRRRRRKNFIEQMSLDPLRALGYRTTITLRMCVQTTQGQGTGTPVHPAKLCVPILRRKEDLPFLTRADGRLPLRRGSVGQPKRIWSNVAGDSPQRVHSGDMGGSRMGLEE